MDFCYLAQSMQIDEQMCAKIDAALKEFYAHKDSIINAGARWGKKHVIDNWYSGSQNRPNVWLFWIDGLGVD